jgi:transposase
MQYIQGTSRDQLVLIPDCLDSVLPHDHEVRLIDLFVEAQNMADHGFELRTASEGRPAYNPKDLLRLFIYGYLNGIRSSRKLEAECHRNLEVMWLMKQLAPDHNTISNFRRDNGKAIKAVFKATVSLAWHFELIGSKLLAGDSTKLRAQNSKKNNFNQKKIDRHLQHIEARLQEYTQALAQADGDPEKQAEIKQGMATQKHRRAKYKSMEAELAASNQEQISTTDPDSRQMIIRNGITEVAYNVQSTTDAKHNIPIDYEVTQHNDTKAMGQMLQQAIDILGTTDFTALYDKGYHTGSELKKAEELGVNTLVAVPDVSSAGMAPDHAFNVANFKWNADQYTYTCPQGHILKTNGTWYNKDRSSATRKHTTTTRVQHFKTPACKTCPMLNQCTKNTRGRGRVIERSEYQPYYDANRKRVDENIKLYRRRQAIIEHNYGTIKRQWGFSYIITKRYMHRASADVGLMFTCYNLRRIMNLMDKNTLKKYLEKLALIIFRFSTPVKPFSARILNPFFTPHKTPAPNLKPAYALFFIGISYFWGSF